MRMKDRIARELVDGETCEWSIGALRTVGRVTQAGKLCLTQRRLVFVPNGYGNLKQRPGWSADRANLSGISVAKRTWQPYNGGMQRRLLIRGADGSEQHFVLRHVDAVAADLRDRLSLQADDVVNEA